MTPSISQAEFEILCRRIPVPVAEDMKAELYRQYPYLEEMCRLVRKPRSHTAEPAHVFAASEKGAFDGK